MTAVDEYLIQEINEAFKKGHKLQPVRHRESDGEDIELDIPFDWVMNIFPIVDIISPVVQFDRTLIYQYIDRLINLLPEVKRHCVINQDILAVLETLLLALDYLTHEKHFDAPFTEEVNNQLNEILKEMFETDKSFSFSSDSNRPQLNISPIHVNEDGRVYVKDGRAKRNLVSRLVLYPKRDSMMSHFKDVGYFLSTVNLSPNTSEISYEDMLESKTDVQLHERMLFHFNLVQRALCWFLNSTSWNTNELHSFDTFDLAGKVGIR